MTADDNHYPGPDWGTMFAVIGTVAVAGLAVWVVFYLAEAVGL